MKGSVINKRRLEQLKKVAQHIAPGACFIIGFLSKGLPKAWAVADRKLKESTARVTQTLLEHTNNLATEVWPTARNIIDYRPTAADRMMNAAQKVAWEKFAKEKVKTQLIIQKARLEQKALLEMWLPTFAITQQIQKENERKFANFLVAVYTRPKVTPQPMLIDLLKLAPHKKWGEELLTEKWLKQKANEYALRATQIKTAKVRLKISARLLLSELRQEVMKPFEFAKLRGGKILKRYLSSSEVEHLKQIFREFMAECSFLISELVHDSINTFLKIKVLLFPRGKAFLKTAKSTILLLKSCLRVYIRYVNAGARNKRYQYESAEFILAVVLWCYILNFLRIATDYGTFNRYKKFHTLPNWLKNIIYLIFGVFRIDKLPAIHEKETDLPIIYFYVKQLFGYICSGILFKVFILTLKFLIIDNDILEKQSLVMERDSSGLPPYATLDPDKWFPLI